MEIGGIQKFTMSDYPGQLSAVLFTIGCNFRCPYCHNPELVLPEQYAQPIEEEKILSFLESRIGQLDGVVITGGEPTLQKDLDRFIGQLKKMNYLVKLDTNGTNPETLSKLTQSNLVDYIAMDYKAPISKYKEVVDNDQFNPKNISASLKILKNSDIDYEIRTTIVNNLLNRDDIIQIRKEVGDVQKHYLQEFNPEQTLDPDLTDKKIDSRDLSKLEAIKNSANVKIR